MGINVVRLSSINERQLYITLYKPYELQRQCRILLLFRPFIFNGAYFSNLFLISIIFPPLRLTLLTLLSSPNELALKLLQKATKCLAT